MALTKISRGLLDTGVSDSSDATAITIDSSERVGIGSTSPVAPLTINDKATFSFNVNDAVYGNNLYYDSTDDRWERLSGNGGGAYYQTAGTHIWYATSAGGATGDAVTPTELARITSAGQLAVGTTGFGTGVLAYDRDVGAPYWGMNVTENSTYNDNSGHTFTSKHNTHGVIYIKDEGGNTGYAALPFYPNGGGGVAYEWNILDPDGATWTTGNVGFGLGGSANLDFTVAFAGGSGNITVTRTAGTNLYRVVIVELAQQ